MDGTEKDILEKVGAFSFRIGLVPIEWVTSQTDPVPLKHDNNHDVCETWWQSHQPQSNLAERIGEVLMPADASQYDFGLIEKVWRDVNDHRIELWESKTGRVVHLNAYIDARKDFVEFSRTLVQLTRTIGCMFFFWSEEEFANPSMTAIFASINRSATAARAAGNTRIWTRH
jgi:hypothetical protein